MTLGGGSWLGGAAWSLTEGMGPPIGVSRTAGLSGVSPQALNEEKAAYDRSPSKNIYLNVAVNTLKKLRGLAPSAVPGLSSKSVGRGGLGVASRRFRPALPAEGGYEPPGEILRQEAAVRLS